MIVRNVGYRLALFGGLLALAVAGCGGGGGGGSSAPPTTPPTAPPPTATAAVNPCSSAQTGINQPCSNYAVGSNPSGLTVLLNGKAIGTTPTSVVPNPSFSPTGSALPNQLPPGVAVPSQITIQTGTAQPPYVVTFNQLRNGAQQVFYNRAVDTQGSIATGYQSVARAGQSLAAVSLGATRRSVSRNLRQRPSVDTTQLYVKYLQSSLKMTGRQGRDIEGAAGLGSGRDLIDSGGYVTRVVSIPAGQNYATAAAALARHSEVAKVEPVHLRYPLASVVTPNDPFLTQMNNAQWDMFQIQMPAAWGYTTGSGVTIAVLDTGYDASSQDFTKVTQAVSFTSGNGSGPTAGAPDNDGHGSNTAGIAGAVTNNGFGFAGTGFNVGLMIVKIIGSNGITTADEAAAIMYATNNGARVISLSIGGAQVDANGDSGYDDTEAAGINYALSHNVVVVAAAGNEGYPYTEGKAPVCNSSAPACGATNLDYPAAYPGVISVGASACVDNGVVCTSEYVASYSNGGPGLTLVAPGGDPSGDGDNDNFHWIYNLSSTLVGGKFACHPENFAGVCGEQFAGTSQATPHVAGAAALALALNPGMTPAQVSELLASTADYLPGIDPSYQGRGRLNVARALAKLKGDTSFPSYRPAANQFVAFAYTNSGATSAAPAIINVFYKTGVPLGSDGTFRVADISPSGAYKIGVWYDANGNGVVDAGDYFGASGACSTTAPCAASGLAVAPLGSNVMP